MELRPLTTHPAFLPLFGVLAVIATMLTLQSATQREHAIDASKPTSTPVHGTVATAGMVTPAVPVTLSATIVRVDLARERGGPDAIVVRESGVYAAREVRLELTERTRVVAPWGDGYAIGGPEDLVAGQRAQIRLARGDRLATGAAVGEVRIPAGTHGRASTLEA